MLSIYRRHKSSCKQTARDSKKCRCPLWLTGTLFGESYRKSAKTRSWEAAEKIKRTIEDGNQKEQPQSITLQAALDAWVRDGENRNLHKSTLAKHKLLRRVLTEWADSRIERLADCTIDSIRDFRATWKFAPRTADKTLARLRGFFRFCQDNGWITANPAKAIKGPKVKVKPRIPFTQDEVEKILAATENDLDLAFILTLRHTGLRIGDASLLRTSHLSGGRIYLHTAKAGTPVSIVIPPNLVSLLKSLPTPGGYFFLRGESTDVHTTSDLWRRRFKILCKTAGVMPDHAHRMRHTLATDLLSKGVPTEAVAAVLGNTPSIVSKHYASWVSQRQDALDAAIESTWKPALQLVKK